ncbi:unnamed protein product [Vitrella brassicaformis CCMP3155]|uniref:HIT domain-containing protein n=1 Tax=Vitrella brassicaformis (strain CCMP3155) TaxID=1169540 RepID=A0A0G4EE38_VITBC|nr:unnamed protein product [Vitrella brassicaformis CCMP3155]|eukprot:CEL93604.1 unnamed protein product [Vitrella brassicaformis CCMP3155]
MSRPRQEVRAIQVRVSNSLASGEQVDNDDNDSRSHIACQLKGARRAMRMRTSWWSMQLSATTSGGTTRSATRSGRPHLAHFVPQPSANLQPTAAERAAVEEPLRGHELLMWTRLIEDESQLLHRLGSQLRGPALLARGFVSPDDPVTLTVLPPKDKTSSCRDEEEAAGATTTLKLSGQLDGEGAPSLGEVTAARPALNAARYTDTPLEPPNLYAEQGRRLLLFYLFAGALLRAWLGGNLLVTSGGTMVILGGTFPLPMVRKMNELGLQLAEEQRQHLLQQWRIYLTAPPQLSFHTPAYISVPHLHLHVLVPPFAHGKERKHDLREWARVESIDRVKARLEREQQSVSSIG